MKHFKREKKYKECPRCGLRCLINAEVCNDCGLVFSRMQIASNADAKAKIKRREKEYIIYTSQLPSDVSFLKLISLCILFGLYGAHSFYVGRYWRGIIPLVVMTILTFFTIFNAEMVAIDGTGETLGIISTILGFVMIMWPIDIVLIFMNKFKVPVAIDIDKKVANEKQDNKDSKTVVNKEVELNNIQQEVLDDVGAMKQENAEDNKEEKQKEENKQ